MFFSRFLLAAAAVAHPAWSALVPVGAGSYADSVPPGWAGPSESAGVPALPFTSPAFSQIPATNHWWSPFIWKYESGNRLGVDMHPWPWAIRPRGSGLGMAYLPAPTASSAQYHHSMGLEDFTAGIAGLNASETRVERYGDWDVCALWKDATRSFKATLGNGFAYAYFEVSGGDAQITMSGSFTLISNSAGSAVVQAGSAYYGFYGPSGSNWQISGKVFSNTLLGLGYYSVALLPDISPSTLQLYKDHAYAFPYATRADWSYDESTAKLTAFYTVSATAKEGAESAVLQALFRQQWLNSPDAVTTLSYESPRGKMKVFVGNRFSTLQAFHGMLPQLPDYGSYSRTQLISYVRCALAGNCGSIWPSSPDTYFWGKAFGKAADLIWLADQMGLTPERDSLVRDTESKLQDWFDASGGVGRLFYYDSAWKSLIGYPANFGANTELNDHHFHYAYWIRAFAALARFDPSWWNSSGWQPMARELIADVANPDRSNPRYPFIRNFSPYEGLFWANGHAAAQGDDQESSSEGAQLGASLIQLGFECGDKAMRDLGIYLYTSMASSAAQYYFDADKAVFPAAYDHAVTGILWGDGADYRTYFSTAPQAIFMIQCLPISASALYLGGIPEALRAGVGEVYARQGAPSAYKEIVWGAEALYDPAFALANYNADPGYAQDDGSSKAETYHWLHFFNCAGRLDTGVSADSPAFAVFDNYGVKTWCGYNPSTATATLHFTDGHVMALAPKELRADGSCLAGPTPTRSPTATASASPSATATASMTPALSPTLTATRSPSPTATASATPSLTQSVTASVTLTQSPSTSRTGTYSFTPTASATATRSVTQTSTPSVTLTATPTLTPTPTLSLTSTASATPCVTPSASPTLSWTGTATGTGTMTGSPTATPSGTWTGTRTGTVSLTWTQSATPTGSPSMTETGSSTASGTQTETASLTLTVSQTLVATPSLSGLATMASRSPEATGTASATASPTASQSPSGVVTLTGSPAPSRTPSASPTATMTGTLSPTASQSPSDMASPTSSPAPSRTLTPSPTAPVSGTLLLAYSFNLLVFNSAGEVVRVLARNAPIAGPPGDWAVLDGLALPDLPKAAVMRAGGRDVAFDGRNGQGQPLASGVYRVELDLSGPSGVVSPYEGSVTVLRGGGAARLCVYSSAGERVRCLDLVGAPAPRGEGRLASGTFDGSKPLRLDWEDAHAVWDGMDEGGFPVTQGVYILRLEGAGDSRQWQVLVLRPTDDGPKLAAGQNPWRGGRLQLSWGPGTQACLYSAAGELLQCGGDGWIEDRGYGPGFYFIRAKKGGRIAIVKLAVLK